MVTEPRVKQIVKQMLATDQELKHKDFNDNGSTVTTAGILNNVTQIQQGTESYQRVGDVIKLKKLIYHAQFNAEETLGTDIHNTFRLIWFFWNDVANPNSSAIIQDTSHPITSQITHDYQQEGTLKIISDSTFQVRTDTMNVQKNIQKTHKLKHQIVYQEGSDSLGVGTLWYAIFSDSVITPNPYYTMSSRIMFTDG